jgi:hypothetical protein
LILDTENVSATFKESMPTESVYLSVHKTVRFAIYPAGMEGPRILAEVSKEALKTHCGASESPGEIVASYQANFGKIQMMALEKYANSPSAFILIDEEDFKQSNQDD